MYIEIFKNIISNKNLLKNIEGNIFLTCHRDTFNNYIPTVEHKKTSDQIILFCCKFITNGK